MRKKFKYQILVGIFSIVLLGVGTYIGFSCVSSKDIPKDDNEEIQEKITDEKNKNIDTVSTKKYDIELTYIDYYTLCGESVENTKQIYDTTIDELKKEQEKYQEENGLVYEIQNQSKDKLVYYRTIEKNCPNHFVVKIVDKKIIIYNDEGNGNIKEYKKVDDVVVSLLREDLKQELKKGINVDSVKNLELLIEDLQS